MQGLSAALVESFGGVVPEIAARAHVEALDGVIEAALADAENETLQETLKRLRVKL